MTALATVTDLFKGSNFAQGYATTAIDMSSTRIDTRTEYGPYYESSSGSNSSSEQHPSHSYLRSIDHSQYLNVTPERLSHSERPMGTEASDYLTQSPLPPLALYRYPDYLNFAPEHKHLQCHSTGACSISTTVYATVPRLVQVPQKVYCNQAFHSRERSVAFQVKGSSDLGVQIFDISHVVVEGKRETPLSSVVYRSLNVRINWPGYEDYLGRIKICEGEPTTRIALLCELARIIQDFMRSPGRCRNTDWNLGHIDLNKLVITRLVHCGGADWQPQLWCPRH
ncbi:hypothetical protein BT96DRAFT_991886 [Gymnopus androsaceus JB14]|uniref:Uncharacterized protein n=1 Tax=Gymnopus androsaceus JB14 TaxID=1447944 RepID=A0A6A4HY64_9AGAR|nr:hypothetical protein BT96DRAFT_991886 [Gymnopus androsaceus JB14]